MNAPGNANRLPRVAALSWDDCRLLVDSVADYAIFMLDPDGRVATWNLGAERTKGYRADEIVGRHFSAFYPPEDVASGKPARKLSEAVEHGRVEDEGWRVRKDGSLFWANVVITALRGEGGELRGFAKVTRDLTERRRADEELHRSEERFHHLIDAVTDYAIFMLDPDGRVATWNPGAERAKGYRADEIVGRHFSAFYTAEDRAAGRPETILETVRREGRFEDEGWRVRKDGTQFWANVIITALRGEGGELVGFAKITRDLTERRRADEELRRSEERFRLLVEGVGDYAIYMLDPAGRVSTWNLGAERMKGYRADEITGRNFSAFFPERDVRDGKPARELEVARAEGRFEDEGWRVRKDGTQFWANVVVTALRDARGELVGYAKITRDLTARRQAEETERRLTQERVARAAAEEASRIKDEFLATVSHELRTPLNAIVGWASMLRRRRVDPEVARAVEVIDRNARAQVKIVDDILDVSRIVTGKLRVEPRPMDLAAVAAEAIEVVRPSAAAKQIALEFDPRPDACLMLGDPDRLQQVVWNLLSNAVKFTDPGGAIRLGLRREAAAVVLSVADTGLGIEPDFLPHVFERFLQADASTTRRFGGLGLGLSLVRHIVELHGGVAAVESEGPGKGSSFTVTLPARAAAPPPSRPGDAGPRAEAAAGSLRGVRVLVIDDDDDARDLLAAVLGQAGATVEAAGSAEQGFYAARRFRPHVLISDISMPGEDGNSLIRRLRSLDPAEGGAVPAIALTAYTRVEDRARAIAAGFTAHLGKPVDPDDLVSTVESLAALAAR
jgi:PAS domain S-box-containing protein